MIEILDPTRELRDGTMVYAGRPASLEGLRIALVENTKSKSEAILIKIGERLVSDYGAADVKVFHKTFSSVPVHDQIIDSIRSDFDVMVSGVGDCGSCSSGTVLDGILLEREGIPSATIVTAPFVPTGRAMARQWAVSDYNFLVMPHPVANLDGAELDAVVVDVVPGIARLLCKDPS